MLDVIAQYPNPVRVNGQVFINGKSAYDAFKNTNQAIRIDLNFTPASEQAQGEPSKPSTPSRIPADGPYYRIKVKPYMCRESSAGFDFMERFNDNIPMPRRIMEGRIVRETKGMYRMELHALTKVDNVKWTGWVIKSAITEMEEIEVPGFLE